MIMCADDLVVSAAASLRPFGDDVWQRKAAIGCNSVVSFGGIFVVAQCFGPMAMTEAQPQHAILQGSVRLRRAICDLQCS